LRAIHQFECHVIHHHHSRMGDHTSLKAWHEAQAVTLAVIELGKTTWRPYLSALFSQLQRASLSVQLNISEGYTFGDSPTFTRHLSVAYGSAVETGELLQLLGHRASSMQRHYRRFGSATPSAND
jgi:four helix bundle protein